MSQAITRGVKVEVESRYVPEKSDPEKNIYYFNYRVAITNGGKETVQLLSRHWIITNEAGREEEVKGPGVVGEQPILGAGAFYEYTSHCLLDTPFGMMHGTYQMVTEDGLKFEVEIAPFTLAREERILH